MTQPRPSRRARWAIGLGLTAMFATVTFGAAVVALAQVFDSLQEEGGSWVDSTATATILDVDVFDLDGDVVPLRFDREAGAAGYAEVDIRFTNSGQASDGVQKSVTWMSWPDDLALPAVGDKVSIEYNSGDPEYLPRLAELDGPGSGSVTSVTSVPSVPAGSDPVEDEPGTVSAPVRRTIAVSGLLTLITLVATVIWARRADPARPEPPPGWNPPVQQYPHHPRPQFQEYPAPPAGGLTPPG